MNWPLRPSNSSFCAGFLAGIASLLVLCLFFDPVLATDESEVFDMDEKALHLVKSYILEHIDKTDKIPLFEVFTVWKAKVLQNWKYLISSTLPDGMYYEITYNGDKKEWYLDAYKKFENRCIPE